MKERKTERKRKRVKGGGGGWHQHPREVSATRALRTNFSAMGMSWEKEGWPVGLGWSKMVLEDVDM